MARISPVCFQFNETSRFRLLLPRCNQFSRASRTDARPKNAYRERAVSVTSVSAIWKFLYRRTSGCDGNLISYVQEEMAITLRARAKELFYGKFRQRN